MNPNYIHTITIYNCLKKEDNPDEKKEIWKKTVLHNCYYKNAIGRVSSDTRIVTANVYTARIPESENYLPYKEWAKRSAEERKGFFTFSMNDIVVYGESMEEITGVSPYTASEQLKKWKPDAFVITAFTDNTAHPCSRHYRLGG